jgi:hypothetical protein
MTQTQTSPIAETTAVALVSAHMRAYTDGDLEAARRNVADNVQCWTNDIHLDGIEPYMVGLARFAESLETGGLRIVAARGDDTKAIILAEHTVKGVPSPFPSARTFELDAEGKIYRERVVFFDIAM